MEQEKKSKIPERTQTRKIKKDKVSSSNIYAVIRISGLVKVNKDIEETLERLRLKRKYSCVLVDSLNKDLIGMIEKVKFKIAFGEIEKDTLSKLLKSRAEPNLKICKNKQEKEKLEKEIFEKLGKDMDKISEELLNGKKLSYFGLKPFFRLHPPRGGIDSKIQYPKGVLGNNGKDINKLIERML